jgi:hypothetical protein
MAVEFQFLKRLACDGGPKESQYEELSSVFSSINTKRKAGVIQDCDIEKTWQNMSEVFYTSETMQGFATIKPYGYSGDFEIIERIYEYWKSPHEYLVNWDNFFHAQAAPQAVRNRRHYFLDLLNNLHNSKNSARVLNIASGPAREVVEFLSSKNGSIFFECVDCDEHAIAYSSKIAKSVNHHVQFHRANAFQFRSEKIFDLVWSAGLFDYLDDRAFKILLKKLLRFVNKDGELVVGNFSPDNSTRDYMEFGNWHLNHRTATELVRLAMDSGVPEEQISVRSEPLGVNLFLHIYK